MEGGPAVVDGDARAEAMVIQVTCDCGQVMAVDASAIGQQIQCTACGNTIQVPVVAVQQPVAAGVRPVVVHAPSSGLAIASLVLGIIGLLGFCFAPFGVLPGSIGAILGIVAVAKKHGGRGMAIGGIVTGAASVVISLAAFAIPLLMFAAMGRGARAPGPPPTVAVTPPARAPEAVQGVPQVLTGQEIADALTPPIERKPDPSAAARELTRAQALFPGRNDRPGDLYRCVKGFRLHLAYKGDGKFDDPSHEAMFKTACREVVDAVLERYRQAGELQQDGKWKEAEAAYKKLAKFVPDPDNAVSRNVSEQMKYCRHRIQADGGF